jgi:excisionase family DNA binding protein
MSEEWITTEEAAELLNVTGAHVRYLLLQGKLKGRKFGHVWAVLRSSVLNYLTHRPKPGPKPKLRDDANAA